MSRVAAVTGASQGLGAGIVAGLADELGPASTVYLTARNVEAGTETVRRLNDAGLTGVVFAPLDVCRAGDVERFSEVLRELHGGVDIFVSNATAHFSRERSQAEDVENFVHTNNLALTGLMRSVGPLLRADARFVVMASSFGRIDGRFETDHPRLRIFAETFGSNWSFSTEQAGRLADPELTLDQIDVIMAGYVQDVIDGTASLKGWPDWINVPSKAGQIAAVRSFAGTIEAAGLPGILVNAVDPGFTDTGGARTFGLDVSTARSVDEAAEVASWAMLLPPGADHPQGQLIRDRVVVPWP